MEQQEKYSALAAKHFAGQASPAEQQDLFAWTSTHADHQKLFEEWTQTWAMAENTRTIPFEADLGAAWAKVEAAISYPKPLSSTPLSAKIFHLSKTVRRWSVAAAILLGVAAATWWYSRQPEQPQFVELQTVAKERKMVTLPDSSHVWLNENSTLVYSADFGKRHVSLEGEAFFEVKRLVERPFEIVSGSATTTVLGTSFNVRAYAHEPKIEVTVKTGKVALASNKAKHSPVFLIPGETGVFDKKAEKLEVAVQEMENADAWKTQQLVFDDEKMAQVITSLERYFDVEIEVSDTTLLDCPYTSSFQQPDLDAILTVIGSTIGFEFSKSEGRYLLVGKGCR